MSRLTSVLEKLSSNGREMLAVGVSSTQQATLLERRDYEECKWHCLLGLDVMPCYHPVIKVEDFMQLLSQAKGRALAERPVLMGKNSWLATAASGDEEAAPVANLLDLDDREQQVVAFLQEHREATEMDLRSVLGTRRVTGIVNGILTKAAEKGVKIIEKRGVGDRPRGDLWLRWRVTELDAMSVVWKVSRSSMLLRRGTVPESGLGRLAVGLVTKEKVISSQLEFVGTGHADCKFVRGEYGSGKTFLISRAVEISRAAKFVTSHVVISPDTPLHKLQAVYAKICAGLSTLTGEHALKSIFDTWIYGIEDRLISAGFDEEDPALTDQTAKEIEAVLTRVSGINSGLAAAFLTYYQANNRGDFATSQSAIGWIAGEQTVGRTFKSQAGLKGTVTEGDALSFLNGLVHIIVQAGYAGLLVSFDEVETGPTQSFARPQREKGLHQSPSDRGHDRPQRTCQTVFSCLRERPALFDSAKGIRSLPPLYDRIGMIADDGFSNPMQTQIVLPKFGVKKLEEVSLRVMEIYTEAYSEVDKTRVSLRLRTMIERVTSRFGGRVDVVPRLYLREFVDVLDKCALYDTYNPAEKYAFVPKESDSSLKGEEKAVMEVSW